MQKISIHNEEKVKELLENNWEKTFRYSQILLQTLMKWQLYQKMLENY